MAKIYSLAIEVGSAHIPNGLGYLISFETKNDTPPAQDPDFPAWSAQLRDAVVRAGDHPFNPDPYTRKVAIAELMYEIEKLNAAFKNFNIAAQGHAPVVQVQSSNPHDKRIHISFAEEEGQLSIVEKKSLAQNPGRIAADGAVTVLDGSRRSFPFAPLRSCGTPVPPQNAADKKAGHHHPRP